MRAHIHSGPFKASVAMWHYARHSQHRSTVLKKNQKKKKKKKKIKDVQHVHTCIFFSFILREGGKEMKYDDRTS